MLRHPFSFPTIWENKNGQPNRSATPPNRCLFSAVSGLKMGTSSVLRAIRSELDVFFQIYMKKGGRLINEHPEGKAYLNLFVIDENYFYVYPNNTEVVGHIDEKLCAAVISTYGQARLLMECFRVNNHYLDNVTAYSRMQATLPSAELAKDNIENLLNVNLPEWGMQLKKSHQDFFREKENLFKEIDAYLKAHSGL